ncbi:MAG: pyrimidine-nucleoside phosphorylase [Tenericutes bacterium HGW-Tenericutes-6]|nr:MAG: pyrimidine-nucleoside phosphorylase [Tenericutes bacterium HGW-Tenericutes-6]
MHIVDIIAKKRDGFALTKEEIDYLISNYTKGKIPDYQMSAFLMATYFNKMNDEESTYLALAMRDSGDVIDLSSIEGIKVDKHSTGGVGDKVTLILGPLLASLGVKFAKMSGRGLGHTGGTIDKLESIPGYKVELKVEDFIKQVKNIGIAIVGQSGDVAPADKKLYALRDVTATVDVIPLIASSIMSKKLASGADAIVLDVKVGHGAFMKTEEEAIKLAELMVSIGHLAGKKMTAILTGMDEPLGHKIGNALEVYEAIETLNGQGPKDLVDVTVEIGAHLLIDAKIETDFERAKIRLHEALQNGKAYQKFLELVEAQGGNLKALENPIQLLSKKTEEVLSNTSGYIMDMNALDIGKAAMRLGAGRETKEDEVLLDVGLDLHKKIGDYVNKGEKIATLYVRDKGIEEAKRLILNAIHIGDVKHQLTLIKKTIKAS